eukprot:765201-Hanusia_phi.AAC.1
MVKKSSTDCHFPSQSRAISASDRPTQQSCHLRQRRRGRRGEATGVEQLSIQTAGSPPKTLTAKEGEEEMRGGEEKEAKAGIQPVNHEGRNRRPGWKSREKQVEEERRGKVR